MKTSLRSFAVSAALVLAAVPFATAQTYTGIQDAIPVAVGLDGATKYDGWYNLSNMAKTKVVDGVEYTFAANTGYPTVFASANAWATPIYSQLHSGTQAAFNKVANGNGTGGLNKFNADGTRNATTWGGTGSGPYPAGDSLYAISFSNTFNAKGGTFGVFESAPVANLKTVVLQVEIGSANGYDFWQPGVASNSSTPTGAANSLAIGALSDFAAWSPVINLTLTDNSTVTLAANFAALLNKGFNGTIDMPTGPNGELVAESIWINLYGFQWDLSAYNNIASYTVTFDVVEHSQTYSVQLDQSDLFNGESLSSITTSAVPEPSTYAAFAGLGVLILAVVRRRARRA